ncbi:MAG: GvpL/GvpF family gas vesicle protein [Pseudomonadota bacterium]
MAVGITWADVARTHDQAQFSTFGDLAIIRTHAASARDRLADMIACHRRWSSFLPFAPRSRATPQMAAAWLADHHARARAELARLDGMSQISILAQDDQAAPKTTGETLRARAKAHAIRRDRSRKACHFFAQIGPAGPKVDRKTRVLPGGVATDILVPRSAVPAFADDLAQQLRQAPLENWHCMITGPWPPLAFFEGPCNG